MQHTYIPNGTCSTKITFTCDENNIIHDILFERGCDGNLKMLSKLLDGKSANEVISLCRGNLCGARETSCANQLANAVESAIKN